MLHTLKPLYFLTWKITTRPSSEAQSHVKKISDNNKIRLTKTDKNFSYYCLCPSKCFSWLPNLSVEDLWGISQLHMHLGKGWPNTTGCINEPSIPVSSPCVVRPAKPTQHRECCLKSNNTHPCIYRSCFLWPGASTLQPKFKRDPTLKAAVWNWSIKWVVVYYKHHHYHSRTVSHDNRHPISNVWLITFYGGFFFGFF